MLAARPDGVCEGPSITGVCARGGRFAGPAKRASLPVRTAKEHMMDLLRDLIAGLNYARFRVQTPFNSKFHARPSEALGPPGGAVVVRRAVS